MTLALEKLIEAQKHAMSLRPKVAGFPVLAEVLRQAGVTRNIWALPSCQSIYVANFGVVVQPGTSLIHTACEVAPFNQEALIQALRTDQAGQSTFPEFLKSAWQAGVIGYEVDFEKRVVAYFGAQGETYTEEYPQAQITEKNL